MNKLLTGLYKRLDNLLDNSTELFFAERPFLYEDVAPEIKPIPATLQNNMEIEKVLKAIKFELMLIEEKKKKAIPPPVQTKLVLDNPTHNVL
jgi:hypothetical protein